MYYGFLFLMLVIAWIIIWVGVQQRMLRELRVQGSVVGGVKSKDAAQDRAREYHALIEEMRETRKARIMEMCEGVDFVTEQEICDSLNISAASVARYLKELQKETRLIMKEGPGKKRRYYPMHE